MISCFDFFDFDLEVFLDSIFTCFKANFKPVEVHLGWVEARMGGGR